MKFDPYNHKEKYSAWKERVKNGIPRISKESSDLILQYLNDMERGINVSNKCAKGPREIISLDKNRQRLVDIAIKFKTHYNIDSIVGLDEDMLIGFIADLKQGIIKKGDGGNYRCIRDFVKTYKAFWHWYMKYSKKKGVEIKEITTDLDSSQEKPDWVYLTEEQVRLLADSSILYYKTLIYFLYDTGIRAPTELMNIKVSDFYNDFKELNIREEISKTFGRRIKLMMSSQLIKNFIQIYNLQINDFLFTKYPSTVNSYLKENSKKIFGDKLSPAGQKYSELSMYDFRHCSCCYWLPRYKSESALMYRFGWKKSDKIHYYSELLGMKDTISEEDMLIDKSKTEVEQKLESSEKEKDLLKERLLIMEKQMSKIIELTSKLNINN